MQISEEAGVVVAAHIAQELQTQLNSFDQKDEQENRSQASFLHRDFDQESFRNQYWNAPDQKRGKRPLNLK